MYGEAYHDGSGLPVLSHFEINQSRQNRRIDLPPSSFREQPVFGVQVGPVWINYSSECHVLFVVMPFLSIQDIIDSMSHRKRNIHSEESSTKIATKKKSPSAHVLREKIGEPRRWIEDYAGGDGTRSNGKGKGKRRATEEEAPSLDVDIRNSLMLPSCVLKHRWLSHC